MHHYIRSTLYGAAIAATVLLSLRGATAFYKQFTTGPVSEAPTQDTPSPVRNTSKAERLARASSLVAGMGKQGTVRDVFSAPDGSTGVVIQAEGGNFIGWMVDGTDALWVGAKFDARGRNMTQEEMIARGYAQPVSAQASPNTSPGQTPGAGQAQGKGQGQGQGGSAGGLIRAVNQSAGFIEGSAGPVWTAYVDANCSFCNQLWRNLRGPIAAGQIRVRWAPVAVIAPNSNAKAATLLQSGDPLGVLAQHGVNGQPIPDSSASAATQLKIDANNAMLRALNGGKAPATPTIVIPMDNGLPQIITGIPPNIDALIKPGKS